MKLSRQDFSKIKTALHEDVGAGDITSRLLIPASARAEAFILAKQEGVFCGGEVARAVFRTADSRLKVSLPVRDGAFVKKGRKVLRISGSLQSILKAERTALNFLGHLSGISTRTAGFVKRVRNYRTRILDTRKTTPLWRNLEKYAVKTGGGCNHRMGLYDAVFVKENHRTRGDMNNLQKVSGKFEIEVRNMKELAEALKLKPKVILLDNFKPAQIRKAVRLARGQNRKVILEASGGINESNVAAYAATGVDQISIGALTHSIPCFDFSLLIQSR